MNREPGIFLVRHAGSGSRRGILLRSSAAASLVGVVVVAGVERLGKQQQVADPVAVPGEVGLMGELVGVSLGVVGPDVLDFVSQLCVALVSSM